MKHPITDSRRASEFRFDASLDEWLAYKQGYFDALDDADDAREAAEKPAAPFVHDEQEKFKLD